MSKPDSNHFSGTAGQKATFENSSTASVINDRINTEDSEKKEHPTRYSQLSAKKLKQLREKVYNRTITKEEYRRLFWQKRLTNRRNEGIKQFWINERRLIKKGLPTTRNWSAEQRKDILSGKKPKHKGKAMASHHVYSVAKYPQLANRHEFIYPVTVYEHIYGWHGGNTKSSLPGKPINRIKEEF